MKVIDQGIVFESNADRGRQSCAFSGVCVLKSGRWLVTCRAAPAKKATEGQQVLLRFSDDEGRSWSKVSCPFNEIPTVSGRPGVFRAAYLTELDDGRILACLYWLDASNPDLPFFNAETNGLLDSRIMLAYSDDAGESWTTPQLLDTEPLKVAVPLTGPALKLANGEIACQFEKQKHYYSPEVWRHSSALIFLHGNGPEWSECVEVSNDPDNRIFYWDQRPGVMPDGRLLDLFWTYNRQDNFYLNIHSSESLDQGRSWSELRDTGVPGQPAPPVGLDDGRIVMVYLDRTADPVLKSRISSDNGRTWPAETESVIFSITADYEQDARKGTMADAWTEMSKFLLGLPTLDKLPGNRLLLTFYHGNDSDHTNVHWMKLEV